MMSMVEVFEILAVLLAIAYLLLAIRQDPLCWLAAALSTLIYLVLMYRVELYMQTLLQLFYLYMAAYGYWSWRHGGEEHASGELSVRQWNIRQHFLSVASILFLTGIIGYLMTEHTGANQAYLDTFISLSAMLTTWMVTQKILDNWLYWIVIDSLSVWLYLEADLYFTAGLYVFYTLMCIFGYREWKKTLIEQT